MPKSRLADARNAHKLYLRRSPLSILFTWVMSSRLCKDLEGAVFPFQLRARWKREYGSLVKQLERDLPEKLLSFVALPMDLAGAFSTGSHIVGGTEYMFDSNVPLFIRLLSLFHVATPPLLLWAIQRLGYNRRGWLCQTLTAWVVVPVNYFWRPQFDVNWARGPFFREQHAMPGLLYLLGYLVVVPLVVYFPSHLLLQWWARRGGFLLAEDRRK
jgi:hypothetical protein